VLSFLYERRRVPRAFAPWPILAKTGDDATLAAVIAYRGAPAIVNDTQKRYREHPDSGDGNYNVAINAAIDSGHVNVLLAMCASCACKGTYALYYALRQGRLDIALTVCETLDETPQFLASVAARADHVEFVEMTVRNNPRIVLDDVAKTAAANGSMCVIDHLMTTCCGAIHWNKPFAVAAWRGSLTIVRTLHSHICIDRLDPARAFEMAAAGGCTAIVEFFLDTVDEQRLDYDTAIHTASSTEHGFRPLYLMHDRGIPIDLQKTFDRYVADGRVAAVVHMCAKSPWLRRQAAIETTHSERIARAIVAAGRHGLDLDAAITARSLSFGSDYVAKDTVRAYLVRECGCSSKALPDMHGGAKELGS